MRNLAMITAFALALAKPSLPASAQRSITPISPGPGWKFDYATCKGVGEPRPTYCTAGDGGHQWWAWYKLVPTKGNLRGEYLQTFTGIDWVNPYGPVRTKVNCASWETYTFWLGSTKRAWRPINPGSYSEELAELVCN